MTKYIDRGALVRQIICNMAEFIGTPTAVQKHDERCNYVISFLKSIPTADVSPVRHGRWLTWEEQFPGSTPKKTSRLGVFCDKCHNHADNRTDYCPNCGAKMDGGAD